MTTLKNICVFCGAQDAVAQEHLEAGTAMGKMLADNGFSLVYGGGDCGMMGRVANAALTNGAPVTGVFPRHLREIEKEHEGLNEIIIVDTMHERKELMYNKSDAFVILPGGFGTMDEMFEILTWRQLRLHQKPIIIFNHLGYWDHLIALMDNIINERFARANNRTFYEVVHHFDDLLPLLKRDYPTA